MLLPQALDLGLRLGAAFRSPSGVPYSDVNLGVSMLPSLRDMRQIICCLRCPQHGGQHQWNEALMITV